MMNLFTVLNGSKLASFLSKKKTPTPAKVKTPIKYKAANPIIIFMAMFVPKLAERINDFHSSVIKCLNMLVILVLEISL